MSRTRPFPGVAFTEAESRQHVAGMFLSFLRVEEILRGKNVSETFFMLAFWQDCLRDGKKKKERLVYPDQISH